MAAIKAIPVFVFLLTGIQVLAQQHDLDSLRGAFHAEQDPGKKIDIFYEIANDRSFDNPISGFLYADSLEEMSKKAGYKKGIAMALHLRGFAYDDQGETGKALDLFREELKIFKALNDLDEQSTALTNIGSAWSSLGRQDSAIAYYLLSMEMDEKRGDTLGISIHHNNIGSIYSEEGVFDKAIDHFEKALALRQAMKAEKRYVPCYSYLATTYGRMKQFDKAEEIGKKGIEYALKYDNLSYAGIIANTLGSNCIDQKKYAEAIPWLEKTQEYWKPLNNEIYNTYVYYNLAEAYAGLRDTEKALLYANTGYEIVNRLQLNAQYELYYKVFANIYEARGEIQKAFDWYKKYVTVADSIFRQNNTQKVAQIEAQYEAEKKEAQLVRQQLELAKQSAQKRTILFISLGMLAVVTGGFFYGRNRQKARQREAELQARLSEAETHRLQELDNVKSAFFANISHEFRTPLTLIMSPIEQMINGTFHGDSQKYLNIILRNGKRLLGLVNDLLELSKLESGRLRLSAAPGHLHTLVKAIAGSFESLATRQQVNLQIETEDQDALVYYDRPKLETILVNLISNAFKFTGEGGSITVRSHVQDHFAHIMVKDTGIGMSAEHVQHIFDRFTQTTVSEVQQGTGIGLALSKELALLHGGDIDVISEEGHGTTFHVSLRVDQTFFKPEEFQDRDESTETLIEHHNVIAGSPTSAISAPVRMGEILAHQTKPLILIAEDNPDVREYIRDIVGSQFQVITANNGREGLEKAEESVPDLVITDVMMPEMDGTAFCRALKGSEKTSHIPVVMLTARAEQADKLQGLQTGADDYLIKPFEAQELLVRIQNLIAQRQKLQEHFRRTFAGFSVYPTEEKSMDARFLKKVRDAIEKNLDDDTFSVVELGKGVGMSRSQLHRKLTSLTGHSPNEVIRNMRLEQSRGLLEAKAGTVSEIAYRCGFGSPAYFVKCYKDYFGHTPTETPLKSTSW